MFCDTSSFNSQESSLFDKGPENSDELTRKSIDEESLICESIAKGGVRDSQVIDFQNLELFSCKEDTRPLSIQSNSFFFSIPANWSPPITKVKLFSSLPPLPTISENSNSIESPILKNGLVWDSYPSIQDVDNTEALELTSSYCLPAVTQNTIGTSSKKQHKKLHLKARNFIKVKIFTNIDEEVIVLRREQGSLDTMNSFLGTILRKLENSYGVTLQSIKLYLLFSDRRLKEIELFQGDPSSCLYTPLIMEYIHTRDRIQVKATISL